MCLVGTMLIIFFFFSVFVFFVFVVSCVLNVASVSGLSSSCLVYSMLPVSLDCSFLIALMVFCNTYFDTTIEYRYKDQ